MPQGGDRLERVLDLIGRVYDAALDEKLWAALAPAFAQAFNSTSTAVQIRAPETNATQILVRSENIDDRMDRAYCEYYYKQDIWFQRAEQFGIDKIVASMDLIADSELERTEFFHDWCRRVDQYYILGSVFSLDGGSLAAVAVHRPHSSGNYDERDKALVALFLPHLQRALQLRRRLAEPGIAAGAALDALERSGMATVVVTRDGRVLYANREAERLAQGVTGSP